MYKIYNEQFTIFTEICIMESVELLSKSEMCVHCADWSSIKKICLFKWNWHSIPILCIIECTLPYKIWMILMRIYIVLKSTKQGAQDTSPGPSWVPISGFHSTNWYPFITWVESSKCRSMTCQMTLLPCRGLNPWTLHPQSGGVNHLTMTPENCTSGK